jgi:OmpA-OmpF porin, OOP family
MQRADQESQVSVRGDGISEGVMNRILKQLVVSAALLGAVGQQASADNNGWYLATDLAYTRFNTVSSYAQPPRQIAVSSESGGGYRIGGGYQFSNNFALEADYLDAGHTDVGPDAVLPKFGNQSDIMRSHGFTIDAIGSLAVSNTVSVYARAGVISATTERKVYRNGSSIPTEPDMYTHGRHPGAGFGVAYQVDGNWAVRVQWQRFYGLGSSDIAVRGNLDMVSLGVAYLY